MGERHLTITAHIIPGVALPLLVGRDFKDTHIECPTLQKQVNELNSPRIFFFKDKKVTKARMTLKKVRGIHRDMDHPDHARMTAECTRLGQTIDRSKELRISRVIQECQVCKNKSRLFTHGSPGGTGSPTLSASMNCPTISSLSRSPPTSRRRTTHGETWCTRRRGRRSTPWRSLRSTPHWP